MRRTGSRVIKKKPVVTPLSRGLFQSLPNTDPGLAGETGVSGEVGTVYGLDRLNRDAIQKWPSESIAYVAASGSASVTPSGDGFVSEESIVPNYWESIPTVLVR